MSSDCFVRDCSKSRFMGYYVCAEHFVFYASARYTESMIMKVEPIGFWRVYPEGIAATPASLNTPNRSQ
jgi:hypothetical protein